jgi:Coenzyme PQQ synthesis protein D (PqqD)
MARMHVDTESVNENPSKKAVDGGIRVPDHVVFRSFPGETVALNLNTGQYHGLNPVAGRMIEVLSESGDIAGAATSLAAEYDQPEEVVEADLRELCSSLLERGLIEAPAHGED